MVLMQKLTVTDPFVRTASERAYWRSVLSVDATERTRWRSKNGRNDGSLMFFTPAYPIVVSPHVMPLPYDTLRDLTPISVICSYPLFLTVNAALPVKSVTRCNLLEEEDLPLQWTDGGVDVDVTPFQVVTLKLEI